MIRQAQRADSAILAELAVEMWQDNTVEALKSQLEALLEKDDAVCFIKLVEGIPVGFAQCQLRRDYVEGTKSSPVGYLEGIYIRDKYRHCGYAKELLDCCETWAKEKQCSEFASDCELVNEDSLRFHLAVGFEEANRIICFNKSLQ